MRITTLEEHDEAAQLQSEPTSPVLGLNSGQPELTVYTDSLKEMKFEMHTTKGAQPSALHDRLKTEITPNLNSTTTLRSTERLSDGIARNPLTTSTTATTIPRSFQSKNPSYSSELVSNRSYEKEAAYNSRPFSVANTTARSLSFDPVDLQTVLPTRTRIRRQRRMGSQDSTEDAMERLNKLRARISGALSEVKGVLNKYSTETEPNDEVTQKAIKLNTQETPIPQEKQAEQVEQVEQSKSDEIGPIQFRFVKKVRRRSLFNDDDEEKKTKTNEVYTEEQQKVQEVTTPKPNQPTQEQLESEIAEKSAPKLHEDDKIQLKENVIPTIEIDDTKVQAETDSSENKKDSKNKTEKNMHKKLVVPEKNEKRRISIGSVKEIESQLIPENIKNQRRPSDSVAIVKKPIKNNFKTIKVSDKVLERLPKHMRNKKQLEEVKTNGGKSESSTKEAEKILPAIILHKTENQKKTKEKESNVTQKPKKCEAENSKNSLNSLKTDVSVTTGKLKKNDSLRRSSIAAVESSKIEPPVKDSITPNIKTQRRPSDSEAILRKMTIKSAGIAASSKALNNEKSRFEKKSQPQQHESQKRMTTSSDDKQSNVLPNQSMNVINNERSIATTSTSPSLATVIGSTTTTAEKAETAITPTARRTEISAAIKDSKFPLILDGHEIANAEVPKSLSKLNEVSSQQAQLNQIPFVQSTSDLSIVSSTEKSIPPSTDNIVNKNKDPQREGQADSSTIEEAIKPNQAISINGAINHNNIAGKTENIINSINENIKKPIHQQEIIPAAKIKTPSPLLSSSSSSSSLQQPLQQQVLSAQQVSISAAELAAIATAADDICMNDKVPEISETTSKESLSEVNVTSTSSSSLSPPSSSENAFISKDSFTDDVITKTKAAASTTNSQSTKSATTSTEPETDIKNKVSMPELQVLPVQVQQDSQLSSPPFGETKEVFPKKKVTLKKFICKKTSEKPQIPKATNEKEQTESTKEAETKDEIQTVYETTAAAESTESIEKTEEPPIEEEHLATPKPPRQVKKKVIIKRLQRRLSGSEQTFFLGPKDEKLTPDVETLEKAIAYVTDDEEEDTETLPNPIQPLKSCMRLREYHVGDPVLYAERYKKTQIRWKKGRIIERITSISYMVDIDGKEVSAHINYLKKYTGRKVRFGGKEYLEIDYEQIAEEEEKANNYSIWNLV